MLQYIGGDRKDAIFSGRLAIKEKVMPDSTVYTDSFKAYHVLDVSEFKHYRVNHTQFLADKYNPIKEIENFWNQAKRHLRIFLRSIFTCF
ncbi:hypothetical protein AGMMS49949_04240 [Alphaproteobacteria bacterium]|nr:hypothetical protein AGMMS49949_04240 [Alphaproteobacteria bacterium]GHS97112.1 hypothetical protein AGMMS50296_3810 [Alphaproteobacteria bacterium]